MKIPLPYIKNTGYKKAHSYPIQIGFQTLEFVQCYGFFYSILDKSAGQYFHDKDAIIKIKKEFLNEGLSTDSWEISWNILSNYIDVFKSNVFQSVVISFQINWDWYISKIGSFVKFCELNKKEKTISNNLIDDLNKIGFKKIDEQIDVLEKVGQLNCNISEEVMNTMRELKLLRNLGLHNRWEIDEFYLKESKTNSFRLDELRVITKEELLIFQKSLLECVNKTWKPIAIKYVDSPEYTGD